MSNKTYENKKVESKHYTHSNNKTEQSILEEIYLKETLEILEERKTNMFQAKFHKSVIDSIQSAIDKIAVAKYHAQVINNRNFLENLKEIK